LAPSFSWAQENPAWKKLNHSEVITNFRFFIVSNYLKYAAPSASSVLLQSSSFTNLFFYSSRNHDNFHLLCGINMSKEEKPITEEETEEISAEAIAAFRRKLNFRVRHIQNVQNAALLLADRLAEKGEFNLARRLVQRSLCHDSSKFEGIEWDYLDIPSSDKLNRRNLKLAIHQHQQGNDHHPEYFPGGVSDMSRVQLAEMVCDWKARSEEFGSSLVDWVKDVACERYGFTVRSKVYHRIKFFLDLLLDPKIGNV
jgi:hypothetical protein